MTTPSVVYFHGSGVAVGKEASKLARHDPAGLAQFAKRDMGKAHYHAPLRGYDMPPEVIQALVLRKLKEDAAVTLGEFHKAVITVPAYFNEPRRKATMDAGRLAGLEVVDIINEPTAAAIAYGVQQGFLSARGEAGATQRILVYDLGGGTFDATLMEIDGRRYRALGTDGDVFLGGIDWDERIADYLAQQFRAAYHVDLRQDPLAWQSLLEEAEDAKRALSARGKVTVRLVFGGQQLQTPLYGEQLEEMTGDLIDRTMFTVKNLLRDAKLRWSDLTRILLVGGSSRMPMVQKALERETDVPLDRSMLAEEPVALGAAIYADLLQPGKSSSRPKIAVHNVCSHPLGVLGIETQSGLPRRKVLIPRNAPLPASGAGIFRTHKAGQARVGVQVVEGGDDSGKNATPVGVCVVSDLPPGLPAGTPVEVRFTYAANGCLQVKAALPGRATEVVMALERPFGLSAQALEQWQKWIRAGAILQVRESASPPAVPPGPPPLPPGEAPPALPVDAPPVLLMEVPPEGPPPEGAADEETVDWSFLQQAAKSRWRSVPNPPVHRGHSRSAPPPDAKSDDDSGLDDFLQGLGK